MSENYINTGYNLIKNMKGYSLHPCVYYSSEMSYDTKNIFLLYFWLVKPLYGLLIKNQEWKK